ncbi:hypothetical protein SRRS_07070 [Sporomusa rhizae]|uniref:hypothetical protein n=1 Tax=Sporomusa rhizae TaxID=357999 RepID=UPI00352B2BD2
MSDQYTGEFDDEFLNEIKSMEPPPSQESGLLLTVPSEAAHNVLIVREQQAIEQAKQEAAVNKRKTYLTSEIPVRPCTADCPKRLTCRDFVKGRVADRDLCKPELRQIKKWQVAFRRGELDKIKDDAGAVAGAMAIQIHRLIEQAILDGVIVDSVKQVIPVEGTDDDGKPFEPIIINEKKAHPAIQQAANLCKTLGINLNEFLMTPKAAKDAGPQVQVNVGISAEEVNARFAARFGQRKPADTT